MITQIAIFERALHRQMPELLIEWCSPEQVATDIEDRLHVELDRCVDQTFAERFAEACPVQGCVPMDYAQRVLTIDDQSLLTGIRFRGGPGGSPFVDLIASAQPLDDANSMHAALACIRAEYAAFDPDAIRLLRSANRPLPLPENVRSVVDQHIVIGPVDSLVDQPDVTIPANLSLEPVEDIEEAAHFVASAYQSFIAEHPAFESIVFPADEKDLSECNETGVLVYFTVEGERAGLLATRAELGPLVRGQTVVEEVLRAEFRGRGLAAFAQRLVIEELARQFPGELVCGTIDDRNPASRATARRVGRREVAAWHWLRWD